MEMQTCEMVSEGRREKDRESKRICNGRGAVVVPQDSFLAAVFLTGV